MFKNKIDSLVIIIVAFVLVACATPYEKRGFKGGYEDSLVDANIFYVQVAANSFTSHDTTLQYFHRRAKELCIEQGYQDSRILDKQDKSVFLPLDDNKTSGYVYPTIGGNIECLPEEKYLSNLPRLTNDDSADAQYNQGMKYYSGEGVSKDYALAADLFRKAAERGHAKAQLMLGLAYSDGKGKPQDHNKAAVWNRKAAERGLADAQLLIGLMYNEGVGVSQDLDQAASWYSKAAEQGFPGAQFKLGVAYYYGNGVPQDDIEAYMWINLAADNQDSDAINFRKDFEKKLMPSQVEIGKRLSEKWKEKHPIKIRSN